jgi:hypothetical protein
VFVRVRGTESIHETSVEYSLDIQGAVGPRSDLPTPMADAGDDRTVDIGATIELDATGSSDPDSDSLTYEWQQTSGPSVDLAGADTATPEFTPATTGTYEFEVTVSDGTASDTDSVTVTVEEPADGFIQGTVRDTDGDPVMNADIRVTGPGFNRTFVNGTDGNGDYTIRVPGPDTGESYTVEITKQGYEPFSTDGVSVAPGATERIEVTLVEVTDDPGPAPGVEVEIKDRSVEIDPFPVPNGDAPTVSINASNATTVFLNTSVGDQTACTPMRNVGGNEWEVDLGRVDSPDLDGLNRGSRVNISIVTASENCGGTRYDVLNQTSEAFPLTDLPTDDSRATYPSQVVQKQPLHYHVFDDVVQVSVVVADYEGQEHVWENETLREWKQAIEYDTSSYLGSDRGAMGSIGFDLQYFDDGGDLYELQSQSAYTSVDPTAPLNSGVTRFTEDARSAALGDNTGRFVVASPTTLGNAQVFEPPFASVSTDAPYRAYVPVYKSSGVWVEELSHLYLGMGDLYSVSNTGNVVGGIRTGDASSGIMASYNGRPGIRLPAPYSVFSRTRLNDLGPRDSVDDEWPWVSINQRRLAPGSGNQGSVTVSAHRPSNLNIGDTVEVVNTNKRVVIGEIEATSVTGRVGTGTVKYAFEVREESRQVRGYRFVEGTSPTGSLISATNVSSGTVDGERSYVTNGLFVEFSTTDRLVDGEYQPEVTTEYTASGANTVVGSITSTVSERLSATFLERPNVTAPDVDLRAVDSQGRVTGVTETGEFVNEIPGARASGDRIGSIEWIAVPRNSSVEFVVSSVDAQEFLNQTNKSAENLNLSYRTEVTEVGGDPRLISDNGSVSVTDTTTEVTNQSIKPGQARTVSNNTSSDLDNRSLPRIVGDAPPTDPDNDNLYEDINGDGEISYVDVVKLFETFGSGIIENNPSIFDFNDNGRVDFDDIVTIFKEIIE